MEEDISGASFSDVDLEAPQSQYSKYLDDICPYYLMFGMTWDEFWNESLDRLGHYWQMHQFKLEERNQELWLQGIYIQEAVASVFDTKHKAKYPEKPHRITKMTEVEQEAENKRTVEEMRNALIEHKRRWNAKHKGVDTA